MTVRRIALGLLLAGTLGLAFGASGAAAARPLATGITTPDGGGNERLAYDRIKASGADFTRVIIFWSQVAPTAEPVAWNPADPGDPEYHWDHFDLAIRNAVDAGLTPLVQIFSAPKWAERCEAPGEPGICNPDPQDFRKFVKAAVARYSGTFGDLPRVRFWQPWNEPNLHIFFKPQREAGKWPSPDLYRTLLTRFASVVKESDPANRIVGGGLAPLGGRNSVGPLAFTRRLLCMKGRLKPKPVPGCRHKSPFDIWSINPYTTGGPTKKAISRDDVQLGDVPEMVRLIKAAKRAGKITGSAATVPVWVTEFSWDSRPPDPGGLPMGILSRWTAEAMFRTWSAGVSRFFWFTLRDWARNPGDPYRETIESGLYFRGDTIEKDRPKQVLKAFEFPFVAFRKSKGIMIWGRTAGSKPGQVVIRYSRSRDGSGRRIKVVRADSAGIFRALVKTPLGRDRRGYVTATSSGRRAVPFSLKPVKDFVHRPFG